MTKIAPEANFPTDINYDAVVSLARQLLTELADNGHVNPKTGHIESRCNPERLCSLATLIGVSSLVYKQPRYTKPLPDPIVFRDATPEDLSLGDESIEYRAMARAMSNT